MGRYDKHDEVHNRLYVHFLDYSFDFQVVTVGSGSGSCGEFFSDETENGLEMGGRELADLGCGQDVGRN